MCRLSILVAGAALAASGSVAAAKTITLDYTDFRNGSAESTIVSPTGVPNAEVDAGEIAFDVTARGGVPVTGEIFHAFCADIFTSIDPDPAVYTYKTGVTPLAWAGATRDSLDRLFSGFYATVDTAAESAAFQVAVWEIINDTVPGAGQGSKPGPVYDTQAGVFSVEAGSVASDAQAYLDGLAGARTGRYVLTYYDGYVDADTQSQSLISVAPVPLPASALLLVAGIGALGALRRRSRG